MPSDMDQVTAWIGRRGQPLAVGSRRSLSNGDTDSQSEPSGLLGAKSLPTSMPPANILAAAELLARLEELLRPLVERRETVLSVGPLQLDLVTRTVKRGDRTIELLPREFGLLKYMMRREGEVLTRATLFQEVWNYSFNPNSNLVDVHMGRLRRKIDSSNETPMIYSLRGRGFMLRSPG